MTPKCRGDWGRKVIASHGLAPPPATWICSLPDATRDNVTDGLRVKKAKLAAFSVLAGSVVATLGLVTLPASAATDNGAQIKICQQGAGDFGWVDFSGPNQDGLTTTYGIAWSGGQCLTVNGYWWKGKVTITQSGSSTRGPLPHECDVPADYAIDTYTCLLEVPPKGQG